MLGPMAGVTDASFRAVCRMHGCVMAYTEMISAKSVCFGSEHTLRLLDSEIPGVCFDHAGKFLLSAQLFGSDPEIMAEAARILEADPSHRFDMFDINMGCPALKIIKNGEGSALMQNPALAGRIIFSVVNAIKKPVTVKIRKGFSFSCPNAAEVALAAEANGASMVAVHGRTREQQYGGEVDLDIIAAVKAAVKIPVIGNGDVTSPQAAKKMIEQTFCDGVMVSRAAMGNPWIFNQIETFLKNGFIIEPPGREAKLETALLHAGLAVAHKGEHIGTKEMRKLLPWYIKGMRGASGLRARINAAETLDEMKALIDEMA